MLSCAVPSVDFVFAKAEARPEEDLWYAKMLNVVGGRAEAIEVPWLESD